MILENCLYRCFVLFFFPGLVCAPVHLNNSTCPFLYFFNSQDVRCDYIIVVVIRLEVIYSPLEVE